MKRLFILIFIFLPQLFRINPILAQQATLVAVPENDGAIMIKISDNGRWAAGYSYTSSNYMGASVWDLETYQRNQLVPQGQMAAAFDVSDDGSVVVGNYDNKPAFWQDGFLTMLPLPVEDATGDVWSVTPDGSKMAGRVFANDWSAGYACVWENGLLTTVNHATTDRFGDNAYFNEMVALSADGSTMLGCLNYTILPNRTAFLMKDGQYFMFGAENYDPLQGGSTYNFYDVLSMSPDGKYVTGDIYWVEEMWVSEYFCPFRYDVENDVTELFLDDVEVASFAVDNNGNLFGCTPLNFPIRDALLLKNGLWVSLDEEILATYGLDVQDETGYDKLGSVFSVSADGRTLIGVNGTNSFNWVLKLPNLVRTPENSPKPESMKAVVRGGRLLMEGKIERVSIVDTKGVVVFDQHLKIPIVNVTTFASGVYVVTMQDVNGLRNSVKVYIE